MTTNNSIQQQIADLVAEEHQLRARLATGEITEPAENARIAELEVQLDRLWDLLRQRRARAEFGENPNDASERSAREVEGYVD
ncbi:DUF2630 family protein [Millisia brevis]|uniref:DUF2630 family protein n=1 Tax=Millisia brevis TaxID=264148 RepID=UPI000A86FD64|nr:DUF2630 family protein [Millisia brevis]